jgi:copper chaperone CopZ
MIGTVDVPTSGLQEDHPVQGTAAVAYLQVSGMGCPRCAERVRRGLQQLDGVSLAEVNLKEHLVAVMYDPRQVTPPDLVGAVAAAGTGSHHRYHGEFLAQRPAEVVQVGWT